MKKMLIFVFMCCAFNQLSAQGLSADTVKIVCNEAEESLLKANEIKLTKLELMYVQALEDEYDEVYGIVSQDCFRGYRNGQYLLVNWETGEKRQERAEDDEDDFLFEPYHRHRYQEIKPDN